MKILVHMTADGLSDAVAEAVADSIGKIKGLSEEETEALFGIRQNAVYKIVEAWFIEGSVATVEIDTETSTAVLVKNETT